MELTKDSVVRKYRRPKSGSKYPKTVNTLVATCSFNTTQNITPIKDSLETTNISKPFSITSMENKPIALDTFIDSKQNLDLDNNESKSPKLDNYPIVDNKTVDKQPVILFNAINKLKECHDSSKRSNETKRIRRIVKFKNINSKNKASKYNMTLRLEKYYGKANSKTANYSQLQRLYCSDISKVITRSRLLKKVSAKENLLDSQMTFSSGREYDNWSLNSFLSSYSKVPMSCPSQSTLVPQNFSTPMSGDFYDVTTTNSVVEIPCPALHKFDMTKYGKSTFNPKKFREPNIQAIRRPLKDLHMNNKNLFRPKIIRKCDDQPINKALPFSQTYKIDTDYSRKSTTRATSYKDIAGIAHKETNNKINVDPQFMLSSVSDTILCSKWQNDNWYKNSIYKQTERQHSSKRDNLFETIINLDTISTNSSENVFSDVECHIKKAFVKCSEAIPTFNSTNDLNEIWERLAYILDSALNKLQQSLIMEVLELKKLLELFISCRQQADKQTEVNIKDTVLLNNEENLLQNQVRVATKHPQTKADLCLQDNSTKNEIMDRFVLKVNMDERALLPTSLISLNELKTSQIDKNNIEILKLPTFHDVEVGKGDALTTSLPQLAEVNSGFQRVKQIISEPLSFVRENRVAVISYRVVQEPKIKTSKGPFSNKQNTLQNSPTKLSKRTKYIYPLSLLFGIIPREICTKSVNENNITNKSTFVHDLESLPISVSRSNIKKTLTFSNVEFGFIDNHQKYVQDKWYKLNNYPKTEKRSNKQHRLILHASKSINICKKDIYYLLKVKRITHVAIVLKDTKLKCIDDIKYNKSLKANNEYKSLSMSSVTSYQFEKKYCNGLFKTVAKSRITAKNLTKNLLYHQISLMTPFHLHESNNQFVCALPFFYSIEIKGCARYHTFVPYNFSTLFVDERKRTSINNNMVRLSFYKMPCIFKNACIVLTALMSISQQAINITVEEHCTDLETLANSKSITFSEPTIAGTSNSLRNQNNLCMKTMLNDDDKKSISYIRSTIFDNDIKSGPSNMPKNNTFSEIVINLDALASNNCKDKQKKNKSGNVISEEVTYSNTSLHSNKMWYQITSALDSAVKGVRKAFVTAIVELKKLLTIYQEPKNELHYVDTENIHLENRSKATISSQEVNPSASINLASPSNSKHINSAEQLTVKLNMNKSEMLPNKSIHIKELKSRPIVSEYVNILRPLPTENVEVGKGDTNVTVVPLIATRDPNRSQRFKNYFCILLLFLRENLIAATVSIPCIIIAYICLVELIVFARSIDIGIKRWNIRNDNLII